MCLGVGVGNGAGRVGAVEGIPGSIHGEKNCGRSCMVPGETRSQPGA